MDEKLERFMGEIWDIKDSMDSMIHLLKTLESMYEYEEDIEKRYIVKAICLISESINEQMNTAAVCLNNVSQ